MGRYTEAVCRLCRRSGEQLYLKGDRCMSPKCSILKHSAPPGQSYTRRRKQSERGLQLREKQKARYIYGVLEAQFRRHFAEAERQQGVTGENLLRILERRLDNVVYRMGFADSRNQARQLVTHGHFALNGHKAHTPSLLVGAGDVVEVREISRRLEYFKELGKEMKRKAAPAWLTVEPERLAGRVLSLPDRQDIDARITEQSIVEYYSR
jgi:small subunit ribosomal protein S4